MAIYPSPVFLIRIRWRVGPPAPPPGRAPPPPRGWRRSTGTTRRSATAGTARSSNSLPGEHRVHEPDDAAVDLVTPAQRGREHEFDAGEPLRHRGHHVDLRQVLAQPLAD